jgi:hypothetical protein
MISVTVTIVPTATAGELDGWEFSFFGVNTKDFKSRSFMKVLGGAVISLAAHEAGHLLAAEITGMGANGMEERGGYIVAAANEDGWRSASNDERAIFSAAGFIVQSLGSIALTAIPTSRHSDWTVGWNACVTIVSLQYALTDGGTDDYSDTVIMDRNGWPGTEIAWTAGLIGGVTTYLSLDKHE